jgi:hypothetical protein
MQMTVPIADSLQHDSWDADSRLGSQEITTTQYRRITVVFTRHRQWILHWAMWIQSTPQSASFKANLILSLHLDVGLLRGLFMFSE